MQRGVLVPTPKATSPINAIYYKNLGGGCSFGDLEEGLVQDVKEPLGLEEGNGGA